MLQTMLYELQKYDLRVMCRNANDAEPVVEVAMGSEVRTLQLGEFIQFWLSMVELGRQATTAYLMFFGTLPAPSPKRSGKPNSA
jgi:hypothetical protein